MEMVQVRQSRTLACFANLNTSVAISKGMQAVKLLQQNPRVVDWCQLAWVNVCQVVVIVVVTQTVRLLLVLSSRVWMTAALDTATRCLTECMILAEHNSVSQLQNVWTDTDSVQDGVPQTTVWHSFLHSICVNWFRRFAVLKYHLAICPYNNSFHKFWS